MAKFNIYTTKRSEAFKQGYNDGMQYHARHGVLVSMNTVKSIAFSWSVANGFEKLKDYQAGFKKGLYW